jgi:hypothetical protein
MNVELNSRGNGACPLCALNGECHIQDTLAETLNEFSAENDPMEMVIYSCPYFKEKE